MRRAPSVCRSVLRKAPSRAWNWGAYTTRATLGLRVSTSARRDRGPDTHRVAVLVGEGGMGIEQRIVPHEIAGAPKVKECAGPPSG